MHKYCYINCRVGPYTNRRLQTSNPPPYSKQLTHANLPLPSIRPPYEHLPPLLARPLPLLQQHRHLRPNILHQRIRLDIILLPAERIFELAPNALDTIERENHQRNNRHSPPTHFVDHRERQHAAKESEHLFLMDASRSKTTTSATLAVRPPCHSPRSSRNQEAGPQGILTDAPPESASAESSPCAHTPRPGGSTAPAWCSPGASGTSPGRARAGYTARRRNSTAAASPGPGLRSSLAPRAAARRTRRCVARSGCRRRWRRGRG